MRSNGHLFTTFWRWWQGTKFKEFKGKHNDLAMVYGYICQVQFPFCYKLINIKVNIHVTCSQDSNIIQGAHLQSSHLIVSSSSAHFREMMSDELLKKQSNRKRRWYYHLIMLMLFITYSLPSHRLSLLIMWKT